MEYNINFLNKPVKFIKICEGKDILNLSQIVVRDLNKINIAPSSKITCFTEDISEGSLNKIIDGTEKCRDKPNIYHSGNGTCQTPKRDGKSIIEFVQIELENEQYISSIEIYNRDSIEFNELCKNRLATYTLFVKDNFSDSILKFKLNSDYIQKFFFVGLNGLYDKIYKMDQQIEELNKFKNEVNEKHNELVNKLLDRIVELSDKN